MFVLPLPVLGQGKIESWIRRYDSGSDDIAMGVAVDSHNNVIVTGYVSEASGDNDFYTIKYDASGNKIWEVKFDSGKDDRAMDVAVDSCDNVIVTGWRMNDTCDYYTIKYDSDGIKIWDATFDSGITDEVFGIAVDSLDNVVITGHRRDGIGSAYNTVKYTENGVFLWNRIYNPFGTCEAFDVAVDSQNNVIVTGQCGYPTGKYYTLWYDGDGNLLRQAIFGIPGYSDSEGKGVAVDSEDNVIVAGMSGVKVDWTYQLIYRTVKYSTVGDQLWERDYGEPRSFPWRVAVDSHDNYAITGTFTGAGNSKYCTILYDKYGNTVQVLCYSWGYADSAWSVAVDHNDNIIVTGGSKNASGNFDYCTIKYVCVASPPTITSLSPTSGNSGTTVTISGANLLGATSVMFGGIPAASFTVNSGSQITAIAGAGATGKVTVTTPNGTAISAVDFNFLNPLITTSHGSSMPAAATPTQNPVSLPNIVVQGASLSADRVAPGTPVTVVANVANTGTVNGSAKLILYINGQKESSKGVNVNSGSNAQATFTVCRNEPGTYEIYVGKTKAGNFVVRSLPDPNLILYISITLLGIALVVGLAILLRRGQTGN